MLSSLEPEGGLDFADWDPAGYSAVLDRLIHFIVAADQAPADKSTSAPAPSQASGSSPTAENNPPPEIPTVVPIPTAATAAGTATIANGSSLPLLPNDNNMPMALLDPATTPINGSLSRCIARLEILMIPLHELLQAMTPNGRAVRVSELEGMNRFALQRENNDVHNQRALMAITGSMIALDEEVPTLPTGNAKRGRKRGPQGRAWGGKRQPKAQVVAQTAQADDMQTKRAVIPIPDAQVASAGRKGGRANDTVKENDGVPKWVLEAKPTLENGTDEWGSGGQSCWDCGGH
ncbi:hypothetical protein B0H13DRAFT_1933895 [Mycena leptocephala]|nr:hypothetical protein B0H13DRAFT_1933895 [Mycena leptocephala]